MYNFVLCQIVEIERTKDESIARCKTIGYKDEEEKVKAIRIPFDIGTEVLKAEDNFIKNIIKLNDQENGAYIGKLDGRNIDVYLDLNKLLTKHCSVLAKSGAGKSYTVGVLIEEIMDKKIPLLVIDPHGEYSKMQFENSDEKDRLVNFNLKPKGYEVREYGDSKLNEGIKPIKLTKDITNDELVHLLPTRLSSTQLGVLYNALKNMDKLNFSELLMQLEADESSAKWSVINIIEYLNNLGIFSDSPTPYNELIQSGGCTVINVRGIPPEIQEIIVYKVCKDLFELRKNNQVAPFFLVLEEAHNFLPERSFGEKKSSQIMRTIASEGRKFGLGLCVISQRPARIDKSVLSQCTTQILLKVTNPQDLKAISSSVEGINSESESEIKNLTIGTALISGVVDIPLFVNIRPRKSMHGGDAVDILNSGENEKEDEKDLIKEVKSFSKKELLPIIKPRTSVKDIKLMAEGEVEVKTQLIPAAIVTCKDREGEFKILVELVDGLVIIDKEKYQTKKIPDINSLNTTELSILKKVFARKPVADSEAKSLKEKGYLTTDNLLSDEFMFTKLRAVAIYVNPEYLNMKYDQKMEPVLSEDTIKKSFSKLTEIKEFKQCFVVKYEIVKKD